MSKKVVRERRSFAKQWLAVISGSLIALGIQPAQASAERRLEHQSHRSQHHRTQTVQAVIGQQVQAVRVQGAASSRNNGERHSRNFDDFSKHHIKHHSIQEVNGGIVRMSSGVDIDLSSVVTNITLGQNLFADGGSVSITVGGEAKTVTAGTKVSAAEYIAVKQVLAQGVQKIVVDQAGRASGGEVDLTSVAGQGDVIRAANLVIPENVTSLGVFGKGADFHLTGDLDNYGSFYALSNGGRHGGTISAADINNHTGALISSLPPGSDASRGQNTDLSLRASSQFVNDGSITSGGSIAISAGSKLDNSGSITAKRVVSLAAPSIHNTGIVQAQGGDINFNNSADSVLQIDNAGGQLSALNGAINLRDANYSGSFDTRLSGGAVLSQELNINAGNASAYVNVNELTGQVNQTGMAVHVDAATDVLNIGNVCLTGDPTYRNTVGSINITGNINVAEALVIAAAGDITSNNNVSITAGDNAQGYPITLIAGVNFLSVNGGADSATLPPLPASSNVTLGLNSLTGGSIKLGTGNVITARSSSIVGNNPGADVHLIAFQGISPFSGQVSVGATTINTSGRNNGTNGNVEIIAAANATVGTINAQGFNTGSGDLKVTTAQAFPSNAGPVSYNSSGALTSSDFYVPGTTSGSSSFINFAGPIFVRSMTAISGGALSVGNAVTATGTVDLRSGGNISVTSSINSDIFKADAGNNFSQSSGTITAPTIMFISATNNITNGIGALLSSSIIALTSDNGKVGTNAASRLRVDAGTVSFSAANGSAYLTDIDDIGIIFAQVADTLDVSSVGPLTVGANAVVLADNISLRSTTNNIVLTGGFSAGTSGILYANGSISGNGVAAAPLLSLKSDTADIGVSVQTPLNINADNVVVTTPGSANLSDPDQLNFGGGSSFVGATLAALATGNLSSSSNIIANIAVLSGNTLNLAAPVVCSSSLGVLSKGNLTNGNISGGLSAPILVLSSINGNIGTSAAAPLTIDATQLSVSANNGSAFVSDPNALILGPSLVKNSLNVAAGAGLSVTGTQSSSAGDITLTAAENTFSIADNVSVTAVTGITLLQNGTNKQTDKIAIGQNAQLTTTGSPGDIVITVGNSNGKAKTKAPKNVTLVTSNGGTITFKGKQVLTAVTPVNTITAKAADVVISNSLGANNLTLGGNVKISAGP